MRKEKTLQETCAKCSEDGSFVSLAKIDREQIEAMVRVVNADYASVREWIKHAPIKSDQWNALFKLVYDVLHTLSEALLLFDKIKARSHECVFAYLCEKHQELEFDWVFFKQVRFKRNHSLYYGELISYNDWKQVELQLNLYIITLEKAIENKLKEI